MKRKEWLKLTSRPNVAEYVGCIEQLDGCRVVTANTDEPIVRCADCDYRYEDDSYHRCKKHGIIVGFVTGKPPMGFCAWADRRD